MADKKTNPETTASKKRGSSSPSSAPKVNRNDSFIDFIEKGSDNGPAPTLESKPKSPVRRGKPKE